MKDLKRMFVVTSDVSKAGSTGEQEAVEHAAAQSEETADH